MSDKLQFVDLGWSDDKLKFVGHAVAIVDCLSDDAPFPDFIIDPRLLSY